MELLIIFAVLFFAVLVIGGIDNDRPVSQWSDRKLDRMHGKLLYAAKAKSAVGDHGGAKELISKAEEVLLEIGRRASGRSHGDGPSPAQNYSLPNIAGLEFRQITLWDMNEQILKVTPNAVRSFEDVKDEFSLSEEEFAELFKRHEDAIVATGLYSDWNSCLDTQAEESEVLSATEIQVAKTHIDRATINRIIIEVARSNRSK